jgi:hypothetical protein
MLVAITTKVGLKSQIVGQQSQDLLFGVHYNLMLASTTHKPSRSSRPVPVDLNQSSFFACLLAATG